MGGRTILATFPSTYQNVLKFVEIWRSSDRNKNAQFFRDTMYVSLCCGPYTLLLNSSFFTFNYVVGVNAVFIKVSNVH